MLPSSPLLSLLSLLSLPPLPPSPPPSRGATNPAPDRGWVKIRRLRFFGLY